MQEAEVRQLRGNRCGNKAIEIVEKITEKLAANQNSLQILLQLFINTRLKEVMAMPASNHM
jgi:hypothetical protein